MVGEIASTIDGRLRVLVVEDEVSLAEALRESLDLQGFQTVVVHSTEQAWDALWHSSCDLIVLDVMLPEGKEAGFELAQELRGANFHQPILFLTAREAFPERVLGLERGGDYDYLAKPFELVEMSVRLRALARRGDSDQKVVRWQGVSLEVDTRKVLRDEQPVRLTPKEYEVLELFMLNPGRVFARDEVLERVWGRGFTATENLVDIYITNLCNKLGEGVVETVPGMGYRSLGCVVATTE